MSRVRLPTREELAALLEEHYERDVYPPSFDLCERTKAALRAMGSALVPKENPNR